jgi:hypothetical protein
VAPSPQYCVGQGTIKRGKNLIRIQPDETSPFALQRLTPRKEPTGAAVEKVARVVEMTPPRALIRELVRAWNATSPQYSNIARGTDGEVLAFDSSNNMALVTMPRLGKQGRVHTGALQVGTPADKKYGIVKVMSDIPKADIRHLQIRA